MTYLNIKKNKKTFFSFFYSLNKVTALRRQVRPVSGTVSRKVSLPESSHKPTQGRMSTPGVTSSNGARCGITILHVKGLFFFFVYHLLKYLKAAFFPSGIPLWEWEASTSPAQPGPNGSHSRGESVTSSCRGWPSLTWKRIWTGCWE